MWNVQQTFLKTAHARNCVNQDHCSGLLNVEQKYVHQ